MAATFVIFYHSFPLAGVAQFHIFGFLGVAIFFIISGYFITLSWCSHPSLITFAWNRFLRLVPALCIAILFVLLIIGPLVTELSLMGYFASYTTWLYALNLPLLSPVFKLPGVFAHNFFPGEPNGSIWTLHLEARMYAFLVLLGLTGLLGKKRAVVLVTLISAMIFTIVYDMGVNSADLTYIARLPFTFVSSNYLLPLIYSVLFMAGSLLYLYRDKAVYDPAIFLGLALLWALSRYTPYFNTATIICLPYLVIRLGFMKIPFLGRITRYGDFSYGLYIFAFPIQQTIIHFLPSLGPWYLFGLSFPVTLLFAVLSWNLVESKALKFKKHDPRSLLKKVTRAPAIVVQNRRNR